MSLIRDFLRLSKGRISGEFHNKSNVWLTAKTRRQIEVVRLDNSPSRQVNSRELGRERDFKRER